MRPLPQERSDSSFIIHIPHILPYATSSLRSQGWASEGGRNGHFGFAGNDCERASRASGCERLTIHRSQTDFWVLKFCAVNFKSLWSMLIIFYEHQILKFSDNLTAQNFVLTKLFVLNFRGLAAPLIQTAGYLEHKSTALRPLPSLSREKVSAAFGRAQLGCTKQFQLRHEEAIVLSLHDRGPLTIN